MDADLQDEPENLPALLAKLDEGSDVVYTVNVEDGDGAFSPTSALFHYSFSKVAQRRRPAVDRHLSRVQSEVP